MAPEILATQPVTAETGREPGKPEKFPGFIRVRELAIAWGLLALLGILVFLPHLLHGGLYMDDWSDAAGALHPPGGGGVGGAISYFNELLSSCRPLLILFIPLKYIVLGTHIKFLLALAVGLAVLVAGLAYAVLRCLSVPWYHAGVLAGLTLVYPWFDSTRFWESASPISLAIVFALAGLWIALIGLSRRSWALHVCASSLYLLSMLTYELTLPLIACAGILYAFRSGWRNARWPWALDLAMVVIAGLWSTTHTPRSVSTISGDLSHAGEITTHGGELLGRSLFSLGPQPQTMITLLVLAMAAGAGVLAMFLNRNRPLRDSEGWGLRNWMVLFAVGLVFAALGWATFIPADSYYTPTIYGVSNRVNGVAGLGLLLTVYAAFGILGSLARQLFKLRPAWAVAIPLILGIALGVTYVRVLERHSSLWRDAYRSEVAASAVIQHHFPKLPPRTTIFASGYPAWETLGVPIFATSWDLNGRVQLLYGDNSVRAYPVTFELHPICTPTGMELKDQSVPVAPYGTARLFDLSSGHVQIPRTQKECRAALPEFHPGVSYLSNAY